MKGHIILFVFVVLWLICLPGEAKRYCNTAIDVIDHIENFLE